MSETYFTVNRLYLWKDLVIESQGREITGSLLPPTGSDMIGYIPVYVNGEAAVAASDGYQIGMIRATPRLDNGGVEDDIKNESE